MESDPFVPSLSAAGFGAISGAMAGGIAGYFGDSYSIARVGAGATTGGINSRLRGGSFAEGFTSAGMLSAFTYIAASTRAFEVRHSKGVPGQVGDSPGAFGIPERIGGERIRDDAWENVNHHSVKYSVDNGTFDSDLAEYVAKMYSKNASLMKRIFGAPFGGFQGGQGTLFGVPYARGGLVDHVVESFGGFHDFLNHLPFYNPNGTSHCFLYQCNGIAGAITGAMGTVVNGGNVILAAPVAGGAMIPAQARFLFEDAWRSR
jgi:filamentous hemagglutinin